MGNFRPVFPRRASKFMLPLLLPLLVAATGVMSLFGGFCIPDGWQAGKAVTTASLGKSSAKPTITRCMGDIIYSVSQRKVLTDDDVYSGERVTRIYDYPAKVLYTIRGDQNLTCTKSALTDPFVPLCVPDNATMTHIKSYYGVNSTNFDNRKFFMEFAGQVKDVNYRASFTQIEFSPLFMQQWGTSNGESFFNTWEFFNSTIWGTLPPVIFTPPAVCNDVSLGDDVNLYDDCVLSSPLGIL